MTYCHEHRLPVVPQGGNTGLVGGGVPVRDEIVLSLSGMNKIEGMQDGVVVAEAGVVLETLDEYVGKFGCRVPLDLGAKGSCQIGGNVATNAGGSRFIRYGSLRGSVLGLEVVLPDGRVLDVLSTVRKDNTGYDLKQLFIGSEGTLGIITKVAIACPSRSSAVDTVVVKVETFEKTEQLLKVAKSSLGEVLSAFEYMDSASVLLADKNLSHVSDPLNAGEGVDVKQGGGLVLVEVSGSNDGHNRDKVEAFIEKAFEEDIISDGVIAENETQSNGLWELRESLPEALMKSGTGGTLKYDVSLPLSAFSGAITEARERISDIQDVHVVGWGHVGDGNLHLNVAWDSSADGGKVKERLEPWVYEYVKKHRGSVSAEHGIGVMKRDYLGYSKSDVAMEVMRGVKGVVDERGICNPYKVLRDE